MMEKEIKKYRALNSLLETSGTVLFGSSSDIEIPVSELCQAFSLASPVYNRSVSDLSVKNAAKYYEMVVNPLDPKCVLLHIGECDIELFLKDSLEFDNTYREVLKCIRRMNKGCRIGIISLKNPNDSNVIFELNRHLSVIAESEHCEFEDISKSRVWNPRETQNVLDFLCIMGHSVRNKKTFYDLVKILFYYDSACAG